ncbi:MAG: ATP F0F1 synthase subunit B [Aestuariivita sp.]|nr:ATP F0F1 synthase subunit B [Aestuariivita sp.]
MRGLVFTFLFASMATPAVAAKGPFFSLGNTDFVVAIAFILFIAVLIYFKVPRLLTGMLDQRAASIEDELAQAHKLREDAQAVLSRYDKHTRDLKEQNDRMIDAARQEADLAMSRAEKDIDAVVSRRLAAAEDHMVSAKNAVIREIRNNAIGVAVATARDIMIEQITDVEAGELIEEALSEVEVRLN